MNKCVKGLVLAGSIVAILGCGDVGSSSKGDPDGALPDPTSSPVSVSPVSTASISSQATAVVSSSNASDESLANVKPPSSDSPNAGSSIENRASDSSAAPLLEDGTIGESSGNDETETPPSMRVRQRSKVRAGGILDLTFDDVEFKIEKDAPFDRAMLTPEIEAMDGKDVIIRGFILESYQLKNIKEFVLVRDNQECCFGPGAYIYHNMQVEMIGDASAEYTIRPITVRGKFTIKPWIGPDGKCYSVFHIAATSFEK